MSLWIELHCEKQTQIGCLSNNHGGPMALSGDSRSEAAATIARLEGDAKENGWSRSPDGWVCPACAATTVKIEGSK